MQKDIETIVRCIRKENPNLTDSTTLVTAGNPCAGCAGDQSAPPAWALAFVQSREFAEARRFARENTAAPEDVLEALTEAAVQKWARNIASRFAPETVAWQFRESVEFFVYREKFGPLPGSRFVNDAPGKVALFELEDGADGLVVPDAPCLTGGTCPEQL